MAGNVASLNKVIHPVIRRVMPTVISNELVGVQPMTGPVGQIHTLRVRYGQTAAGVAAGDEALSPFAIAKGYSGDALQQAVQLQLQHLKQKLVENFQSKY